MMRRAQPWLGTLVDISVDHANGAQAINAAFAAVALVQRLMSFHEPGSDVSRFNRASPGALVQVDPHTWTVLQLAQQVMAASDGSFNPACAPRLVAWGYLPAPSPVAVQFVPGQAGYALEDEQRVRKTSAAWLDLGGIAKGYAVDLAMAALVEHGVGTACVNAGGDLRVIGPDAWPVTLRAPADPGAAGLHLALRDAALATSGVYFSSKQIGAHAVSALLDGRCGQALTAAASVTVIAPRCVLADALTKVVMASGDAGHPCLAQFGASALII